MYYAELDEPILLLTENEIWVPVNQNSEEVFTLNVSQNIEEDQIIQPDHVNRNEILDADARNVVVEADVQPDAWVVGQEIIADRREILEEGEEDDVDVYLNEKRASFRSWEQYVFPWTQVDPNALYSIMSGTSDDATINQVVRSIISDMKFYRFPCGISELKQVAIQCMTKFPQTFEDRKDDGSRLDNGYNGILQKLQEHNNYLKRPVKRVSNLTDNLDIPLKSQRMLQAIRSGSVNWQPAELPQSETLQTLEVKRSILRNVDLNASIEPESETARIMSVTYPLQSFFSPQCTETSKSQSNLGQVACTIQQKSTLYAF